MTDLNGPRTSQGCNLQGLKPCQRKSSEAAEAEVPRIANAGSSPYICDLTVSGARQMTIGQSMRRTAFGLSVSSQIRRPRL